MALDGIFLYSTINELKNTIIDGKVDKVSQPEKDEIILTIRKRRDSYKLLISSTPKYPRLHLTNLNTKNPMQPPMFCMVLRKYLNNSKILDITQVENDRIAIINFENTDEMGFNSIYSLIVEIMGRHSNITLIRNRDNIIMDSIKHITPNINSYRNIYPGIEYVYPPKSDKLDPFNFNYDEVYNYISDNNIDFNEGIFSKLFTGISKTLSLELSYNLTSNNIDLNIDSLKDILDYCKNIFTSIYSKNFSYSLYKNRKNLIASAQQRKQLTELNGNLQNGRK